MGRVSWPLCIFVFLASFSALRWPNVWPKMGFLGVLKKPLSHFISYLSLTRMGWISWPLGIFVFLASFSALWWPNIWPKMSFRNFLKKKQPLAQFMSYLAFILMVWVYWPLYIFGVPSLIFGPLVAKYLVKNGVYGIFWKNYWFHSLHIWQLPFGYESLDPYSFSCSNPHFRPSGGQVFGGKWGLGIFLTIGSIHDIPGSYPLGMNLLIPIHFLCS